MADSRGPNSGRSSAGPTSPTKAGRAAAHHNKVGMNAVDRLLQVLEEEKDDKARTLEISNQASRPAPRT